VSEEKPPEHPLPTRIVFARWELECDPAVTRELYRAVKSGAPEACGCAPCRNFAAARNQAYPKKVLRLFDDLGIAPDREAEIYHTHRISPGRHHYGGWFHFVGRLVGGPDAETQVMPNAWKLDLEIVEGEFRLGFTNRIGLLRSSFRGQPIVQLEFDATLPWLLSEAEPTR
jgi:hypothetical protein